MSPEGRERVRMQLIRDEGGLLLKPYVDSVGKLTIGAGRNLTDKGITTAEAESLLHNDLRDALGAVLSRLPWSESLSEPRLGALINLAFTMGIGGLLGFRKMLAAMQDERWDEAGRELLDSTYAQQVGERAVRLQTQIVTDRWV